MTEDAAQTLYIDGKWRAADDGGEFPVYGPSIGDVIGSNDISTTIRVTEKLSFGVADVHDIKPMSAVASFGGVKASGLGREGGYEGIDKYLDTKLVGIAI